MNYEEAMSFLEDTKQYGSRPGLDTIRRLMRALGDVQDQVPVIHISGTNGKGSVGAMLSSVFTEAGYRVGWFNTPDVFSYEEEFRMNGDQIGRERLAELFDEVRDACERITAQDESVHPTRFEVETAAAYLWFFEEHCDIAIVEVGMGGAKDATNVISGPLVSVLTSIGMDHTQFLGNSLTEIAVEKAGVIKPECPVVTVEQDPAVMQVILERCRELDVPLYRADTGLNENFSYRDGASEFEWGNTRIRLGLAGPFQMENASCAVKVLEVLRECYPERYPLLTDDVIVVGMESAHWPGRYERISIIRERKPAEGRGSAVEEQAKVRGSAVEEQAKVRGSAVEEQAKGRDSAGHDSRDGRSKGESVIIMDGGHNEIAARRLREALDTDFPGRRILYIMGVLADKDYRAMAAALFREGDRVMTVAPSNHRALPAGELAGTLRRDGIDAVPCGTMRDAVAQSLSEAGDDDVIVALGSLFNLREVRDAVLNSQKIYSEQ